MGWYAVFPLLMLLTTCDTPGLRHMGVAPVRMEVGGMSFDIRVRDGIAEAIRTNAMFGVRMRDVANNGGQAIVSVTGCKVAWLQGDPSVLLAGLDCEDGQGVPRKPRGKTHCTGTVSAPYRNGESDVAFSCG
ncbi:MULTISPECIES: hypothetical protein [unclassified Marinovum]